MEGRPIDKTGRQTIPAPAPVPARSPATKGNVGYIRIYMHSTQQHLGSLNQSPHH